MNRFDFSASPPVFLLQIPTPSLGDHSYLVVADGRAAAIDPQRDLDRVESALAESGARLVAVFETHIHNDYVSGGAVLARRHGADYVLPAGSGASMDHIAITDGEEYRMGEWRLRAIHTPGHTPHHMSYSLVGPEGPTAVLSGGSMLVGAVGRSDLLGPQHTDTLVRDQFHSVRRLASELPDPTRVGPTHGAGSFCSASAVAETTSTIEAERTRNPALLTDDVEEFARTQLAGYGLFPDYYAHMGPINLDGAAPMPADPLPELGVDEIEAALGRGTAVIDLRPAAAWAAGHLPGTISIPFSSDVATYVGWVLPWRTPVVLLSAQRSQIEAIRRQLARIGHDAVAGYAVDIDREWEAAGRPLRSVRVATFADVVAERPEVLVDVRDPKEVEQSGPVAGARNVHVSRVAAEAERLQSGTVWVSCASGYRSAIAAGLLERAGRTAVLVLESVDRYYRMAAAEAG